MNWLEQALYGIFENNPRAVRKWMEDPTPHVLSKYDVAKARELMCPHCNGDLEERELGAECLDCNEYFILRRPPEAA